MDRNPPGVALTSGPSGRCGSLREHGRHTWRGPTTGLALECPGAPAKPAGHICASDVPPEHHGRNRP